MARKKYRQVKAKKPNRAKSKTALMRRPKRKSPGGKFKAPQTLRQYLALAPKDQETWDSIGHVISKIRQGMTLPKAAKEYGLKPKIVISHGRPALMKKKNGRYVAKKTDQLLRVVNALTTAEGRNEIATRDSRQASLVGGHWAAVQKCLQTGDDSALLRFKGKRVADARGKRYLLLTDPQEIERLGSAGVLSFESMYAGSAR